VSRQIAILLSKHQSEIKKLKEMHDRQLKLHEESLIDYRNKYEECLLDIDKKNVEFEKKLQELKRKYENEIKKEVEDKENQLMAKINVLTEKLKQTEDTAELYRDFIQKRRDTPEEDCQNCTGLRRASCTHRAQPLSLRKPSGFDSENEEPERQSRMSRLRNIQEHNVEDRKKLPARRESVKQLAVKIDRALSQLRGSNNSKLH
jgi:hypothetical protein